MANDDTTQTTNPNDTDAPEQPGTGETTGEGERAGTSKGDDYHARQALENKIKAETLNALYASYGVSSAEELRERLAQSPAAPAVTSAETEDDGVDWNAVEAYAAKGDPVAKAQLWNRQRMEQLARGTADAFVVQGIPDQKERNAALAHYEKNRHRLGDVNAALAEIRAPRLQAENARLTAELAKMSKTPDPDVLNAPKTGGREITATEVSKRKMSGTQYDSEVKALHDAGKHRAALDLQRAYANGDVVITG